MLNRFAQLLARIHHVGQGVAGFFRDFLGLAYGFYALCAVLSLVFVWQFVEETKGKALEDMHSDAKRHEPTQT